MTQDSISVTLTTGRAVYSPTDPVDLTLEVVNRTAAAVTFDFTSSQRYDFLVVSAAGDTLWRWSADRMFGQVLSQERLGPGESRSFRESAPAGLSPGHYTALARLVSSNHPAEASTGFAIR